MAKLIAEGGVAGHLAHLYDNRSLTFGKLSEILTAASRGKLVGTEKTDGQNLFLSYSVAEGRAKAARNKGNIKQGGMDAQALASKFADRGALEKAFNDAFAAFEEAGLSNQDEVLKIGKKYRDSILSLGGSRSPNEVFKKFRGRLPSTKALIRHSGLD